MSASHSLGGVQSMSLGTTAGGGPPGPATVRVVTYNVLSSHLGGPDWFTSCAREDLVPSTRLARVLDKLEVEMAKDAVICLQEVSMSWTGA
jgi:mRNA deadenylase 3'-5' endonuclease subunit Ccr4